MIKRIDDEGRTCSKCGTYKLWSEYTPDKRVKTGHAAKCKACKAEWLRGYNATPEGLASTQAAQWRYRGSKMAEARAEEHKRMRRDPLYVPDPKAYSSSGYYEADPVKAAARAAVAREVAAGRFAKADTVQCAHSFRGNCRGGCEYHHHVSYAPKNALDVIPLCRGHHVREHLRLNDAKTPIAY